MKLNHLLRHSYLLLALPSAALAQTPPNAAINPSDYGPHAGSEEFTLGGNGTTNRDLDNSSGSVAAGFGYYFTNNFEGVVRQTAGYTNPAGTSGNVWNGETSVAGDFHFIGQGPIRPFVGANLGYVYGSNIRDSGAAGLEGGAKFYVTPRSFIYAMANYGWLFRHDEAIAARFSTGLWNWGVGVGFNF
jgi:hypothetical protein